MRNKSKEGILRGEAPRIKRESSPLFIYKETKNLRDQFERDNGLRHRDKGRIVGSLLMCNGLRDREGEDCRVLTDVQWFETETGGGLQGPYWCVMVWDTERGRGLQGPYWCAMVWDGDGGGLQGPYWCVMVWDGDRGGLWGPYWCVMVWDTETGGGLQGPYWCVMVWDGDREDCGVLTDV